MRKWDELSYYEKLACVSLYPKEALKDTDESLRLAGYCAMGYPKEMLTDTDGYIRREGYRVLGYTKEALKDKNSIIRDEAETYFRVKEGK